LLADLSDKARESHLTQLSMKRYTPKTIIDRQRLRKEIATTRRRGYAVDDEETALGLKCVAMAVPLPRVGSVAISFSGPAADFTDQRIQEFAKRLATTASRLRQAFAATADYRSDATNPQPGSPGRSRRKTYGDA
jgi:DNA-binding IclR family transcriptional regulator